MNEAIKQYIVTSQDVAREMMKGSDGKPIDKVNRWLCEWAPVFAAVPEIVSLPGCAASSFVKERLDSAKEGIADFRSNLGNLWGKWEYFGWIVDPTFQVEELIDNELKPRFEDFVLNLAGDFLGEGSLMVSLIGMLMKEHDAASLNEEFSHDSSSKGLLLIPDIADRVDAEMHLGGWLPLNFFDPNKYHVAYNSVILSKLALLGKPALNRLVLVSGVDHPIYGPPLFESSTPFNILLDAIASLDGNQQWQEYGIPYPRRSGFADERPPNERQYGYPFDGTKGFRIWQDCEAREKVFKKIFKGPLAPGIQNPSDLGLTEILQENDPNLAPDLNEPFPLSKDAALKIKAIENSTFLIGYPDSASDLLIGVSAPVCGREENVNFKYTWAFLEGPAYLCQCKAEGKLHSRYKTRLTLETGITTLPCDCKRNGTSPESFYLASPRSNNEFDKILSVLKPIVYQHGKFKCTNESIGKYYDCEAGYLTAGNMAGVGSNGIEWEGNLICDKTAYITNLVKVSEEDLKLMVHIEGGPWTLKKDQLVTVKTLGNNPEGFKTWRDVQNQILNETGNDVCSKPALIAPTSESEIPPDQTPPVLHAPGDITVECRPTGGGGQPVELGTPVVSDDRDDIVRATNDAPGFFRLGTTIVTWSATDSAQNTATDEQSVKVVDTQVPKFSGALDPVSIIANNMKGTSVNLTPPVANDTCDGPIVATTTTALTKLPIGTTTVTWVARDRSGNTARIKQMVTVSSIRGDLDLDGDVDLNDLKIITASKGKPVIHDIELEDFNKNGVIDDQDRALFEFIKRYGAKDPRDLNGDGKITSVDEEMLRTLCTRPNCATSGTVERVMILGYVWTQDGKGISGVTMNGLPGNPATDLNGNYLAAVPYGWSGTVTPTKSGYTFAPAFRTYKNVNANLSQNYVGTPLSLYSISGYIYTTEGIQLSTEPKKSLQGYPVPGVVMNGLPGNPSTDTNGFYSATVSSGWSGTVTPTKAGYAFAPSSRTYTNVTSNEGQDYIATMQAMTISGYVRTSGAVGISGVVMNGLPGNPTTDANGFYTGTVPYGWSGTVTPAKAGYSFSPSSKTYNNVISNQSQDYVGTTQTFTISGYVRDAGAVGINGVVMNGLPGNPATDATGFYTGTVPYGWSGTVTPAKAGYSFSPSSKTHSNVTSNQTQDYVGTTQTFTISGYVRDAGAVGINGVVMNGLPGNPATDANGFYTGTVPYGWSGNVTPTKAGYTFNPWFRTYSNVTSNQTQDYVGTAQTFTISGYVRNLSHIGIQGVEMQGFPSGSVITNSSGYYSGTVPYGWSGVLKACSSGGLCFNPSSVNYTNVISNLTQDYQQVMSFVPCYCP